MGAAGVGVRQVGTHAAHSFLVSVILVDLFLLPVPSWTTLVCGLMRKLMCMEYATKMCRLAFCFRTQPCANDNERISRTTLLFELAREAVKP